jgi:quinol monooxygenase YgiN
MMFCDKPRNASLSEAIVVILELAQLQIKVSSIDHFEQDFPRIAELISEAEGCLSVDLHRSIEREAGYVLMICWRRVEDHTVTFRQSPAFAEMTQLLRPHLSHPPQMEHLSRVVGR